MGLKVVSGGQGKGVKEIVDTFRDTLSFSPPPPQASHALPPLPGSFTYPSIELAFVVLGGTVIVSVPMVGQFSSADFLPRPL